MAEKDKVKKALEKSKKQEPKEPEVPEPREVNPLDSNIIFREQLLGRLDNITIVGERIANALESMKNEKH